MRDWRRAGVVVLVAAPLVAAVVAGQGNPLESFAQDGGGAWVVSPSQGLVTLIDGPSEELVASVRVPGSENGLTVTQAESSAYVADQTAGTVTHVDGATYDVSAPVLLGSPGAALHVLQGGGEVVVVDSGRRTAVRVDARTLAVLDQVSLAAAPGPGQSVVDADGRLWVVDAERGGLTWFDTAKHVDADAADAGTRLVLVRDRPVLVDIAAAQVRPVGPTGRVGAATCLDVRPDDEVQVLGSRNGDDVFAAVSATGTVVVAGVGRDDCRRVIGVADPGTATFGPLAQSGRFVFVPDVASGRTSVIDTARDVVVTTFDLTDPGHRVELIAKDGLVFYNDLDGAEAGVLTLDGTTWRVSESLQKYDPDTGAPAVLAPQDAPAAAQPAPQVPGDEPAAPAQAPPTTPTTPPADAAAPPARGIPASTTPVDRPPPTTPPPSDPDEPPVVGNLVIEPAVPALGSSVTFAAAVDNAAGATWEWTLSVASGPQVTTSTQASGFTTTLPTDVGTDFLVELTVSGPGGTSTGAPLAFSASDPFALAITSLTSDAAEYQPLTTAVITPVVQGAGPGATWTWDVTRDGAPFDPQSTPGPGEQLQMSVDVDADLVSQFRVTLTVTDGMRSDTASVDFAGKYVCYLAVEESVDLRSGSGGLNVSAFDCVGDAHATISYPGWITGPATLDIGPSGPTWADFVVSGMPPVDGTSADAIVVTLESTPVLTYPIDVIANLPPVSVNGYTVCVPDTANGRVQFLASFDDGDLDTLDVVVTVNGQSLTLQNGSSAPTLFGEYLPIASLGAATTWTVQATDSSGASSAVVNGSDQWNCW
ncbi:hypothetical protein ASD16_06000 [Cellulomonas sp. Root485]|nr:hypothetical protein ASD16_06000 [Cellulomonas sp. Root485]